MSDIRKLIELRSIILKIGALTNEEAIAMAVKETLRYGMFVGAFAGSFVFVDELIAAMFGSKRTAGWRSFLAGAVSGHSLLLTGARTQHTSLSVYILMRAAVLASRCGIKNKRFGQLCKPLTWEHGDVFLMCLSSAQILCAYILNQDSLPPSYKAFLDQQCEKDPAILQGLKELASGSPFSNLDGIQRHYKSVGVDLTLDPDMQIPCSMLHGTQSCVGHVFSFLVQAYGRAFRFYLPVYMIPALIFHRQGLVNKPKAILGKSMLGVARSSLFLSTYCASTWAWTCLFFRTYNTCNIPLLALSAFHTGLALFIEKKSRRMEISLYCLSRAIESFFVCISDAGLRPPLLKLKRTDVVIFSVSTAIIMHCYAREREVFRSKLLDILDWVFGVPEALGDPDHDKQC